MSFFDGLAATPHPLLSVPCTGCAASLPFAPESESVTCEFCRATSPIPEGARSRARAHLKAITAAWKREIHSRYLGLLHDHAARTNPRTMRCMMVLMVAAPLWLIALGSGYAARAHPLFTLACVGLTIAALSGVLAGLTGPPRPFSIELLVASGLGTCPRCGGPLPVWEGNTTARCCYCSASLVVDEAHRRELLETALRRVAQASDASFDAIRRNASSLRGASSVFGVFGNADLPGVMLAVTMALIAGLAGLGFFLYRDAEPVHDVSWVWVAFLVALVWVTVRSVVRVRRLARAGQELRAILQDPVRR